MKALPLWQPWATLVVIGAKRVETRSWEPPAAVIGQRIAIHATKTAKHLTLATQEPFMEHLDGAGLPLGALVGSVVVARAMPITADLAAWMKRERPAEHAFGDYTPGRWAWVLRDPVRLPRAVPWRGSQGMFTVPDRVAAG